MFGFRRGSSCATFAVAAVAALLLLAALAGSALAISAPIHIAGTAGEGVYIRSEPSTSGARLGWMPEGASPDYNCFVWGQNINGVPIWFNVNYNGVNGYYASFYDDSSYHSNEELTAKYGVPLCGSTPAPPAPAPAPAPTPESAPAPDAAPPASSPPSSPPPTGSQPPKPTCYGDYCSGKNPYKANCTTGSTVAASTNGGDTKLELIWSALCKTKWARMTVPKGWWDPSEIWAEQSTGYKQSAGTGGHFSHATTVVTPMIYSPKKCVSAWYNSGIGYSWNAVHTACR